MTDTPESVRINNRTELGRSAAHDLALDCLAAGIEAAHPRNVVRNRLAYEDGVLRIDGTPYDLSKYDEVVVLGGGKAAAPVAVELERLLGDALTGGVVVTNDPRETDLIEVRTGSHPVPDEDGAAGAQAVLERARKTTAESLVVGVMTGGASALLPAPGAGVDLDDLRETTGTLLEAGASIDEINAVRKHLSAIKGGKLAAAAAPAEIACLLFSDVVGDDPSTIGSGPFVPDETTFRDAREVFEVHDVEAPEAVRERFERGESGEVPETPKPGDVLFEHVTTFTVASSLTACLAARDAAADADHEAMVLTSRIRGEAREAAKSAVAIGEEIRETANPVEPPAVVVTGGETTVTVRGDGEGGPNQEYALGAAVELEEPGVVVAAVDTDGIDGASEYAGGIVAADTVTKGEASAALATNNAEPVLEAADAAIETGPTGTNVNDLRVIVVEDR
ncbi:glycerate kinase type-2 family protein [Haloparvum sp. PAK95]|uniref:glycerate kinase type-2 family protein n=1 Tax=Haloparvum sp. PAK95 TaxID=3418962 RepID=UPI003D2F184C